MADKKKQEETFLTYKPKRISQKVMIGMGSLAGSIGAALLATKLHQKYPMVGNKGIGIGRSLGEGVGRMVTLPTIIPKHFMGNFNKARHGTEAKSLSQLFSEHQNLPSSSFEKAKQKGELITKILAGVGVASLGGDAGEAAARYIDYNDMSRKKKSY